MHGVTGPDWNAVASRPAAHGTIWTRDALYIGFDTLGTGRLEFAQEAQAGRVFHARPARPHIAVT